MAGQSYANTNNLYGTTVNPASYDGTFNASYQSQPTYEERGYWRKLYDYQSGYWYYQNLLTNTTQWEMPQGWDSWPINGEQAQTQSKESDGGNASALSMFRQTSDEIETKNTKFLKRKARRQIDPEKAKKIHWRPEGANEYNIWYDKWIGDHWKGTKDEGRLQISHYTFTSHLTVIIFYFPDKTYLCY